MKLILFSGVIISIILISSLFYFQYYQSESNLSSWGSFSKDAKHSWDGQKLLKDKYSPYQHLPLLYSDVVKESHVMISYEILDAAIGMYSITGEQQYLNEASLIADEIEKLMINDSFVLLQVPSDNMLPLTTNRVALNYIAHLSLLDESKTELVKKLADSTLKYSINNNTNLFYDGNFYNGNPGDPSMYFPYGGDVYLESLLKSYEDL